MLCFCFYSFLHNFHSKSTNYILHVYSIHILLITLSLGLGKASNSSSFNWLLYSFFFSGIITLFFYYLVPSQVVYVLQGICSPTVVWFSLRNIPFFSFFHIFISQFGSSDSSASPSYLSLCFTGYLFFHYTMVFVS